MIHIQNVTKKIKGRMILKDVSFEIHKGDTLAIVGPNGAGKSTLIDCLIGHKKLTSGHIEGGELLTNAEKTSVLFQQTYFNPLMKVHEIIALFAALYDNPLSLSEIQAITQFDDVTMKNDAEKLSGGQKRILDVALTLIGRPEIIIMDEATAGMDTSTRKRFYDIIEQLKDEGRTIIFTSHYIEEVESLADRIIVLNKGAVLRDSSPKDVRRESIEKRIIMPIRYINLKEMLQEYGTVTVEREYMTIQMNDVNQIIKRLVEADVDFNTIEMTQASLIESIFNVVEGGAHETV